MPRVNIPNPLGRAKDSGQDRKPFLDMGEKVPMMNDQDQEVDSDDLAPIVNAPMSPLSAAQEQEETAQADDMDGTSNIPSNGRQDMSGTPISDNMNTHFENGRTYKGSESRGKILQGNSDQLETYE